MSNLYNRNDVHEASNALKEAQISLKVMTEAVWPVGSVVRAKIGRSIIRVKVSGYGSYWAGAGRIHGVNVDTGKSREFHYTQIIEVHDHDQ